MDDDPSCNEAACHPVESSNDPDASVAKDQENDNPEEELTSSSARFLAMASAQDEFATTLESMRRKIADERIRAANQGFSYAMLLRRAQKLAIIDRVVDKVYGQSEPQNAATPAAASVEPKPTLSPDTKAC